MDCADRIAVVATERTIERVRGLTGPDAPDGVTVRALVARRRLDVTIRKVWTRYPDRSTTYGWEVHEVEGDGTRKADGLALHSGPSAADAATTTAAAAAAAEPEDAYWLALEAARALDSVRA